MYLGNVVSLIVVLATVPLFAAILRIPFSIIAPVIIVVCVIGAYTVNNSVSDVGLMMGFGVLGYFFKKLDFPIAPMVLAMVLGDRAEEAFRQSLLLSRGDLSIFWNSPISAALMVLSASLIVLPLLSRLRGRLRGPALAGTP
jgi:TctA family transporter